MNRIRHILILTIFLALTAVLVACGGAEETAEEAGPLTLVQNPWPASELNVAVAKNILENELGYTVEVISLEEQNQWAALAGGDADAVLEVWPSGHMDNIAQYIDEQGVVEDGGRLGPEGIIGWYVPQYVVDTNPELASWEGYQNPELAGLFATAETGEKGQFLGADPSWVQYDADIINNLDLELEVVYAGSEDALLAAVSSAYARQEPVLFYFYSPHAIFSRFDLVQVDLPEYTEECYSDPDNGSVDCEYPTDKLLKVFAADMAEQAPEAHTLLSNFNYTNADQVAMLAMLDEGMSVEEAAQAWLDENESVWRAWLP